MAAFSGCAAGARPAPGSPGPAVRPAAAGAGATTTATPPACLSQAPSALALDRVFDLADARLRAELLRSAPGRFPSITTRAGRWRTSGARGWTSGFFPGSLWLMARATQRAPFASAAGAWTRAEASQSAVATSHDIGFEIFTSFGNGYLVTHRDDYRQVILRAAGALAARYDPAVGAVRSWGAVDDASHFKVIVDGLMNLQLLFWAAHHGGDPSWAQWAARNALVVREHFIRPDGSIVHMVDFDPITGIELRTANPQAHDLASTWARGQAWGVAGFALAYRETHDPRLLDAARRVASYFLGHLPPDCVPYWDFDAPGIPRAPRDSSAAAIAADGLLTLSRLDPEPGRRSADRRAAGGLLAALIADYVSPRGQSLLAHGTANLPAGSFDTGTSYGDYYFLDALLRYRQADGA